MEIITGAYKYYLETLDEAGTQELLTPLKSLFDQIRQTMDREEVHDSMRTSSVSEELHGKNPLTEEFFT